MVETLKLCVDNLSSRVEFQAECSGVQNVERVIEEKKRIEPDSNLEHRESVEDSVHLRAMLGSVSVDSTHLLD